MTLAAPLPEAASAPLPADRLAMPPRAAARIRRTGPGLDRAAPAVRRARWMLVLISLGLAAVLVATFWDGIDRAAMSPFALWPALALFSASALWLSAGAGFALVGLTAARPAMQPATATPGPTAILWLICGESPGPVAARVAAMARDLERNGMAGDCRLFILSDTQDDAAREAEAASFAPLVEAGLAHYRNRIRNIGRKPGNIADWLRRHGARFETMLVMDADSVMTAGRVDAMRRAMAADPGLGLVQSGIRQLPGDSRFAGMQRLSARLCGPAFLQGFAAITGAAGNYWGHNALIRVRAFAGAAGLPRLPGRAPFGGPILSHDFIEAAWLVRAGWSVRVLPQTRGSFESGPETLAEFHRRDRRWCQGNLQHLRLIGAAGLHPLSRLHLMGGVQSYLAAPIWMALLLLFSAGLLVPSPGAPWVLLAVALVLLLPKAVALGHWRHRLGRDRPRARRRVLRAVLSETALTSLVAPLVMVRQTLAVAQVLAGRDSGWRPAGAAASLREGWLEQAAGAALVALALLGDGGGLAALLLVPVAGPLLAAPWLIRWLDRPPAPRTVPVRATPARPVLAAG